MNDMPIRPAKDAEERVLDPVCGMAVDPAAASASAEFAGTRYWFCSAHCREEFLGDAPRYAKGTAAQPCQHSHQAAPVAAMPTSAGRQLAKDPICGMMVDKATALSRERGGRTYYFCSDSCVRTFESPETELKAMQTRVAIALTGVLALALLRAGAFIGLATGAMLMSWVPFDALPFFTWGMWLFLLVTPVQFIGGWSFYKGAWNAIRTRNINMDFLIALGTSVAYFYSVAVLFFPEVLPVKVGEREVYFEVSAVIIAFVLLGKYMEEIIKKKSSAAVRRLLDLKPAIAHVIRDGEEVDLPAESVMVGETLVVKPGEKIPTDGEVSEGQTTIDESMLTGESMPVDKRPGSAVIGGTLNRSGVFRFKASRIGADTALAQIIKMVEEAQASTAQIQRLADLLDQSQGGDAHSLALQAQQAKVDDVSLTPSAQVLAQLQQGKSFTEFALQQSKLHAAYFRSQPLSAEQQAAFEASAAQSLRDQATLEANEDGDFDSFAAAYQASILALAV